MKRVAPNLDFFVWRPILAEPPIYKLRDIREWVTIRDVLEANEALNVREALAEKAHDGNN